MERFQDLCEDNISEKCSVIAEEIRKGDSAVLSLIEQLGILLTDTSATQRGLGIAVLSGVLEKLPTSGCLSAQELSVISTFYAEKLKDNHQVVPCSLKGILTIIAFENFPGEKVAALLNSIFHNVTCQQQQQADRYKIYRIFDILTSKFSTELLSMKLEVVYGVLHSIDGERDPRNLLFLFMWLKSFLGLVSLGHLAEDFFEVIACYFPVDFRAPPSEKSITRETLANALLPCLVAVPEFSEFCIPLALEKLDSSLKIAKIDSLKLLREGCKTFTVAAYIDKAPEITSQVQSVIFSSYTDLITDCLETLTAIINKISQDANAYEDIIRNIVDTLKGNLIPDSSVYQQSEDILYHVALGGANASECVGKEIVPILVNMFVMDSAVDRKLVTLRTLVKITTAFLKSHENLESEAIPDIARVPSLCLETLNCDKLAKKFGLDSLTAMASSLSIEVRLKLYQYLKSCIQSPTDDADLRNSELECLRSLASNFPEEVKLQLFDDKVESTGSVLNALAALINVDGYRDFVNTKFLQGLRNDAIVLFTLEALKCLLEREQGNTAIVLALRNRGLLDILIELALREDSGAMLPNISKILKLMIGPLDCYAQRSILNRHLKAVYERTAACNRYLPVLDGLVGALRRDVQIGYEVVDLALDMALDKVYDVRQIGYREMALQFLANLINKRKEGEEFDQYLEKVKVTIEDSNSRHSIPTILWITKALVMRNSPHGLSWTDNILRLLEDPYSAYFGVEIIVDDDCESLSATCHCNKLPIYQQKIFVHITNKLNDRYTNEFYYSKVIPPLLKHTPLQAIIMRFDRISIHVLTCLEFDEDPEHVIVLLTVIKKILENHSDLIEKHLGDYLSRIMDLTAFEMDMRVRIKALQCLIVVTLTMPLYKLLPFKRDVLYRLSKSVDDRKRLVRKEAVEASARWYLLDLPT